MAHRLVLGGARSGKTGHALALAEAVGARRVYVATAEAGDAEMAERIARHRAERGAGWRTVEAPLELAAALGEAGDVVLVDCLTLWLSNLMLAGRDVEAATAGLLAALEGAAVPVVLVSNEVGMGLVPETPLGRAFRDAQGRLNQRVAAAVARVDFVVAGVRAGGSSERDWRGVGDRALPGGGVAGGGEERGADRAGMGDEDGGAGVGGEGFAGAGEELGDGLAAVRAGVQEVGGPGVEFGAGDVVPGAAFPGAEVRSRRGGNRG